MFNYVFHKIFSRNGRNGQIIKNPPNNYKSLNISNSSKKKKNSKNCIIKSSSSHVLYDTTHVYIRETNIWIRKKTRLTNI